MRAVIRNIRRKIRREFVTISKGRKLLSSYELDKALISKNQAMPPEALLGSTLLSCRRDLLGHLPQQSIGAEIGVARGDFSQEIIDLVRPLKLYLIDSWEGEQSGPYGQSAYESVLAKFSPQIERAEVSIVRAWSDVALKSLDDHLLDWIYIDGGHDYDTVKNDLELASQKVKQDGLICGHDYSRWAPGFSGRMGVVEAVNEFCRTQRYKVRFLTVDHDMNGSYALERAG